jgi:hypothetical protein
MTSRSKSPKIILALLCSAAFSGLSCEPKAELKYSFEARGEDLNKGAVTIQAFVNPDSRVSSRKRVVFKPAIGNSLEEIFHAAQAALKNIYGTGRGEIHLGTESATVANDPVTDSRYYTWVIQNPEQKFCVLPLVDKEKRVVESIVVWVE